LVDYLIRAGVTFVVVDLRGDLVDRVKLRLAAAGTERWRDGKILIMDYREPWCVPFNAIGGAGSPHSRARRCRDNITARSLSWGVTIEECLDACLLALASADPPHTLLEVDALLTRPAFRAEVIRSLDDPYALSWFDRYEALSPEQQQTLTRSVLNKLAPMLSMPAARRSLSARGTVNFRKVIDTPGSAILVALNYAELHSAAPMLGKLIVSAITQALFSRADVPEGEATRPPVCVLMDEFEHLVGPQFAEPFAEQRRFGGFSCLSHQVIGQVGDLSDMMLSAIHLHIAFQNGYSEAARISREVPPELRRLVAGRILTLPVGRAFISERGGRTRLVQAANSPDPSVPAEDVAALSAISAETYARPAAEVDAELMARFAGRPDAAAAAAGHPGKGRKPRTPKAPEPNAVYEVRPRKVRPIVPKEDADEATD
jgi:hypothetical protein